MKKILTVAVLLALCLVMLSSCASKSVVGTWSAAPKKDENTPDKDIVTYTLNFTDTGAYTYTGLKNGETTPTDLSSGTYKVDGDLLIMDGHSGKYTLSGDTLTLTINNVVYTFTQVK